VGEPDGAALVRDVLRGDVLSVERAAEVDHNPLASLVYAYEAILTEMRTVVGNRAIAEWVGRLDFARDEFLLATRQRGG
jgi:hypothetical protein